MKKAIYPGTFDPFTFGHLDILMRSVEMFDKVIVAVAEDASKNALFTINERLEMIKDTIRQNNAISVVSFQGLLISFALNNEATIIIRGLRAISDFEYEFQMALMNRKLSEKISTVFLMPDERYTYLSSTMVREIALLGGDCSSFVPENIEKKLKEKFKFRKT